MSMVSVDTTSCDWLLTWLLEVLSSKVTSGPLRELPVRFILVFIVSWHVLNLFAAGWFSKQCFKSSRSCELSMISWRLSLSVRTWSQAAQRSTVRPRAQKKSSGVFPACRDSAARLADPHSGACVPLPAVAAETTMICPCFLLLSWSCTFGACRPDAGAPPVMWALAIRLNNHINMHITSVMLSISL
jgi:hypothetical protein